MIEEKSLSKAIYGEKYGLQRKISKQLLTVTHSKGGLNTIGN
jgi:hypothetical protein